MRSVFLSGYLNGSWSGLSHGNADLVGLGRSRLRPTPPHGSHLQEISGKNLSNPPTIRIFKVKSKQVQQNEHWCVVKPLPLKGKNCYQAISGINILCPLIWAASSEENHSPLHRQRTPKTRRNFQLPQTVAYGRMISLCINSGYIWACGKNMYQYIFISQ